MQKCDEQTDGRTHRRTYKRHNVISPRPQAGDKNSLGFILQNREHKIVNLSEQMGKTHFRISKIK